jgi:hypothetical protein
LKRLRLNSSDSRGSLTDRPADGLLVHG